MDTQAGAWLFWGGEKIQIAAIQILPLTPIGQYTYDNEWMESVLPYCMDELENSTYGDSFKSVIYAAYAKVNPQIAYGYSADLFDWGSGNSASNQLYFVATQPSTSDICSAAAQTPEGVFYIQDVNTELFVTLDGNGHLQASMGVNVLAAKFELGFKPGGGTIRSVSRDRYVTASPGATTALAASRETVRSYEVFRWAAQPDGTYTLKAMINRALVSTQENGDLLNNVNSTSEIEAGKYRLVQAGETEPVVLPAVGIIRSHASRGWVDSSATGGRLYATATTLDAASRYYFTRVVDSPDDSPYFNIQSVNTSRYVTSNAGGTSPLSASAATAAGWERYQFVPYQGSHIMVHVINGNVVTLQADDTLQDNTKEISDATFWDITEIVYK